MEALKTQSLNIETKQIEVTVNSDTQELAKWGEEYHNDGKKILARFHEYMLKGLPSVGSDKSLLEDFIEVYGTFKSKQQSVYYYVQNHSVYLLLLYTTIYHGCKLAMGEIASRSRVTIFERSNIKLFDEIKNKQEEVLEEMKVSEKCYTNQGEAQKSKRLKDSADFIDEGGIKSFCTEKVVIPKTESYNNFVVTGIKLTEGMAIIRPRNNDTYYQLYGDLIRLQLKIGKIGSGLSISEETWMEVRGKLVRQIPSAGVMNYVDEEEFQRNPKISYSHYEPFWASEEVAQTTDKKINLEQKQSILQMSQQSQRGITMKKM